LNKLEEFRRRKEKERIQDDMAVPGKMKWYIEEWKLESEEIAKEGKKI
jgi:hypothetical protein